MEVVTSRKHPLICLISGKEKLWSRNNCSSKRIQREKSPESARTQLQSGTQPRPLHISSPAEGLGPPAESQRCSRAAPGPPASTAVPFAEQPAKPQCSRLQLLGHCRSASALQATLQPALCLLLLQQKPRGCETSDLPQQEEPTLTALGILKCTQDDLKLFPKSPCRLANVLTNTQGS